MSFRTDFTSTQYNHSPNFFGFGSQFVEFLSFFLALLDKILFFEGEYFSFVFEFFELLLFGNHGG